MCARRSPPRWPPSIVVIPVLMDRAPLPKAASLPEDIRELALYHKHDLVYESFGRDVQALIAAIEAHRQALNEKAASAARLTREQEQAAAEAERRAQQKEKRAEPRPGQAGLPREPFAIMAVAVVVTPPYRTALATRCSAKLGTCGGLRQSAIAAWFQSVQRGLRQLSLCEGIEVCRFDPRHRSWNKQSICRDIRSWIFVATNRQHTMEI